MSRSVELPYWQEIFSKVYFAMPQSTNMGGAEYGEYEGPDAEEFEHLLETLQQELVSKHPSIRAPCDYREQGVYGCRETHAIALNRQSVITASRYHNIAVICVVHNTHSDRAYNAPALAARNARRIAQTIRDMIPPEWQVTPSACLSNGEVVYRRVSPAKA